MTRRDRPGPADQAEQPVDEERGDPDVDQGRVRRTWSTIDLDELRHRPECSIGPAAPRPRARDSRVRRTSRQARLVRRARGRDASQSRSRAGPSRQLHEPVEEHELVGAAAAPAAVEVRARPGEVEIRVRRARRQRELAGVDARRRAGPRGAIAPTAARRPPRGPRPGSPGSTAASTRADDERLDGSSGGRSGSSTTADSGVRAGDPGSGAGRRRRARRSVPPACAGRGPAARSPPRSPVHVRSSATSASRWRRRARDSASSRARRAVSQASGRRPSASWVSASRSSAPAASAGRPAAIRRRPGRPGRLVAGRQLAALAVGGHGLVEPAELEEDAADAGVWQRRGRGRGWRLRRRRPRPPRGDPAAAATWPRRRAPL